MARARSNNSANSSAYLGSESKLRSNMDGAVCKHVVLGLKYISDAFEEQHAMLLAGKGEYAGADPDGSNVQALNVFSVPLTGAIAWRLRASPVFVDEKSRVCGERYER